MTYQIALGVAHVRTRKMKNRLIKDFMDFCITHGIERADSKGTCMTYVHHFWSRIKSSHNLEPCLHVNAQCGEAAGVMRVVG